MKVVPATEEGLMKFYSFKPGITCQAYMAVEGDEIHGVAGFYVMSTGLMIFARLTDRLREMPVFILKTARMIMEKAQEKNLPIYAEADSEIEPAIRFLERLDFEHESGEVFRCHTQQ